MNSSLNRFFKVIWCKLRLTWVAVSEVVRGQGKERSSTRAASREGNDTPGTALQNNLALWQEDHIRLVPLARLQQVAPPKLSPMVALQALSEFDTPRTLFTSVLLISVIYILAYRQVHARQRGQSLQLRREPKPAQAPMAAMPMHSRHSLHSPSWNGR